MVLSKLHFVCIGICFVVLLVLVVVVGISAAPTLHFSNALGSSMVLSRNSSVIWGYSGTENDVINILLDDRKIGTVHANTQINYSWMNNAYEWKFTMPSFGDDESLGHIPQSKMPKEANNFKASTMFTWGNIFVQWSVKHAVHCWQ